MTRMQICIFEQMLIFKILKIPTRMLILSEYQLFKLVINIFNAEQNLGLIGSNR